MLVFLINLLEKKARDPKHVHKRKNVKSLLSTRLIETSVCDERILSVNVLKAYMKLKAGSQPIFSVMSERFFYTNKLWSKRNLIQWYDRAFWSLCNLVVSLMHQY